MSSSVPDWLGPVRDALRDHERERSSGPVAPALSPERFRIGGVLGEGAVGVVYRARDLKLDRDVAVKVLREPVGSSTAIRERFQREARIAALLSHPNIVTVHDVGEAGGQLYLVMELVDGRPLNEVLLKRDRDLQTLVSLLEKVARGVGIAHDRGIVHRDLKPANILVTPAGEPKVGDFGLAHVAGSETGLTKTGTVMGTPLYMAPEQVRGDTKAVGPRTDVYALGAILYEILTGRPPHAGDSVSEIYGKIMTLDPVGPRRLNPAAPRDLETVCMKALEKEPSKRYPTADGFAEELRRYLEGEPVLAKPPGTLRRAVKWTRRHRVAAVLALSFVAVVGTLAVAGLRLSNAGAEASADRKALALLETARPNLEKAFRGLYRKEADPRELAKQVEEAQKLIEQAVATAPRLPMGRHLLGRAWELRGWDDRAEDCWRQAIALDPGFAPAHYHLGRRLLSRSFLVVTEISPETREKVMGDMKRLAGEASAEIELAIQGGLDDELQRQVAAAMLAYARSDEGIADIVESAIGRFGNEEGTEEFYWLKSHYSVVEEERIAALSEAIRRRPKYPLALLTRGIHHLRAHRNELAIRDFDAALSLHPRLAEAYINRANARFFSGDVDGSIADSTSALELRPDSVSARLNRAIARLRRQDLEGSIADATRVLELVPRMAKAYAVRYAARLDAGDLDGAIADAGESIAINPDNPEALAGRGRARARKGVLSPAVEDFQKALDLAPASWPDRPEVERELGEARRRLGDRER